jgi:transposase
MYIRLKTSKKAKYPTMQIVEGVREGKKVKQRTIAHLGVVKGQKDLQRLKKLADNIIQRVEKEGLPVDPKVEISALKHKKTVYDGFGIVVDKLMEITGFSGIIQSAQGRHKFDVEQIIKLILTQRFDLPSSKLRTCERQEEHGFNEIDLQHIYRSMDAIECLDDKIQKQAFTTISNYSEGFVDCFFFDVTTLYFESVLQDEIRDFGFSKDQKYHMVQIVFALVVDSQGMPLAYETFKGNLAETKTLIPVLEKLRNRFSINNVTVVCDRGLASKPNVEALQHGKFHFVIATKLKSMSKKLKINDLSKYVPLAHQINVLQDDQVLFYTSVHPQYPDTMLIATYSPSRARKDREDRNRMLEKLQKKLASSSEEASIKNVISNGGYKKYINIKAGSQLTLNEKAIEEDAKWDGFHGIAVSNSANLSVETALARYRDLWHVEEAFRVAKCTLKTRPIFHWVPHRIKAHVLLCFINLFIERFLELMLRKKGIHLTQDRIRYALSLVHTTTFEDKSSKRVGIMRSSLTEDAEKIFLTLGISTDRDTALQTKCCA